MKKKLVFLSLLIVPMFVNGAAGQDRGEGAIQGHVVGYLGAAGQSSVLVYLDNGAEARVGKDGRFAFPFLPSGPYRIAAVSSGCNVAQGEVTVQAGQVMNVQLHLPPPNPEKSTGPATQSMKSRRSGVAVTVLTATDMKRMGVSNVEAAIRVAFPRMLMTGADYGTGMRIKGARGTTTILGDPTPLIFVDGTRVEHASILTLHATGVEQVERIEIVRGASGGWAYGQGGTNGVIRIYTKSANILRNTDTPAEDCEFLFR